MQGRLSATQDQINWVLTSYIVAAAIMTPLTGFLAARFGRKQLFLDRRRGFTVASVLCGSAQSLEQMVLFRLLQGCSARRWCRCRKPCCSTSTRARSTARRWRCGAWASWSGRSSARRSAAGSPSLQLALGLLHQRAGRHSDLPRPLRLSCRDARSRSSRFDWFGFATLRPRHRRPADDARPRRAARLVLLDRDHASRRRSPGSPLYLFLVHTFTTRASVHRPAHVQGPQLHRRPHLHLHGRHHPARDAGAAARPTCRT